MVALGDRRLARGHPGAWPAAAGRDPAAVLQGHAPGRRGLLQRLQSLAAGTGLTVEGVYRLHLSKETRKANAALAGLGKTRRVLLGDTLLEQFTPEEIEVVFAHEVGHHVHRHLPKMIALQRAAHRRAASGWSMPGSPSCAPALGYAALADPAALPLLLLALGLFGLVLAPLQNALSRFFERQCDRYALDRTGNRTAYRSAFVKLARMNKSDPDPHPCSPGSSTIIRPSASDWRWQTFPDSLRFAPSVPARAPLPNANRQGSLGKIRAMGYISSPVLSTAGKP